MLLQGSEGGDGEGKYLKYAAALLDKVYPGRGMSSSLRLEHVRNMQASDFYKVWKVRPPYPCPKPAGPWALRLWALRPPASLSADPPGGRRRLGRAVAAARAASSCWCGCRAGRAGPRPPAAVPPVCERRGGGQACAQAVGRRRRAVGGACGQVPRERPASGQAAGERAPSRRRGARAAQDFITRLTHLLLEGGEEAGSGAHAEMVGLVEANRWTVLAMATHDSRKLMAMTMKVKSLSVGKAGPPPPGHHERVLARARPPLPPGASASPRAGRPVARPRAARAPGCLGRRALGGVRTGARLLPSS